MSYATTDAKFIGIISIYQSGFLIAYAEIKAQVLREAQLITRKYPTASVIVTGHSLGGALATHAMGHLIKNGITIANFYTFGCPRVGDEKFFSWFKKLYP